MTVEYAADLPVSKHGSGFPTFDTKGSQDENFNYKENLFNLNNLYKSPKSILRIADEKREFISGITVPWVYMGMMFSTFCWHVEDLWLNSINYSHKGGIKTWYVIPASDKGKFDEFVGKKTNDPEFLDRITFMLNPLEIKKAGIRIYRTYQRPGDYICTFFKAYHAGFSQGFNVGEAVNFVCP
jgi:histone demethylase JARID1